VKRYLHKLSNHPGAPIAAVMSAIGVIAGAMRDGTPSSVAAGALIGSIYWIPVLLTVDP